MRTDNRCQIMENCNAADWDGKSMPRPPVRTRQLLDPMAAFQMVHILTGVVERGTATVLRDLDRPLFGKTGTTSGPTNVWFVGGTPDVVAGVYLGYDQPRSLGGMPRRPDRGAELKQSQAASASLTKIPFVAPRESAGAHRPSSGRGCSAPSRPGTRVAVIWEASSRRPSRAASIAKQGSSRRR